MLKFIYLLRRSWTFILFIILEMLSIYLIARTYSTQGIDIVNSTNKLSGNIYEKRENFIAYFELKEVNKQLLKENQWLHNQLAEISGTDTFYETNAEIPVFEKAKEPKDTSRIVNGVKINESNRGKIIRYANYNYIPARVINNSVTNSRINYMTINQGSQSGIKKGMAVVSNTGVVGRIESVSKNFAVVASVLSQRKISAKLKSQEAYFVTWKPGNPNYVQMEDIPLTKKVELKDSIYTTEYSYFPPNILVGQVKKIDTIKSNNTKLLHIKLSTNFRNIQYVYVVGNELGEEQSALESQTSKP